MLTLNGKIIASAFLGGGRWDYSQYTTPSATITHKYNSTTSRKMTSINGNTFAPSLSSAVSGYPFIIFGTDASISSNMTTLSDYYGYADYAFCCCSNQVVQTQEGGTTTQSFTLTNSGSSDITYTCFGRTVQGESSQLTANSAILVSVFMLDTPVTVPAGESRSVQITVDCDDI